MKSEQKTQLWIALGFVALIILITIIAAFASSGSNSSSSSFKSTETSAITSSDHARGNTNAKVTVIEYGDFQCPACGAYEPIMENLYKQYGSQVLFIFRNFPLYQIHPNAMIAAEAAEAANLQGKYWQMHDLLYAKQSEWVDDATANVVADHFNGYAQSLGLNVTQFDSDINSSAVKNRVESDLALGNAADVDHTPTFFINLAQIQNPTSEADFESVLNAALASSTAASSTSTQ